jgi:hypothetical protein
MALTAPLEGKRTLAGFWLAGSRSKANNVLATIAIWFVVIALLCLQRGYGPLFKIFPHIILTLPILVWCSLVNGRSVWTRHIFDVWFAVWLLLALCSQLWASTVLYRVFSLEDTKSVVLTVFSPWLMFRSFFALGFCYPRTVPRQAINAMLVALGFLTFIGVCQWIGPGPVKSLAGAIAIVLSPNRFDIEGNENLFGSVMRVQSFAASPTYFGYYCSVAVSLVCGIIVARRQNLDEKWALKMIPLLFFYLIGMVAAQARLTLGFCIVAIVYTGYICFKAGKPKPGAMIILFLSIGLVGTLAKLDESRRDYLLSIFQQGSSASSPVADTSVTVRAQSFENAWNNRNRLATLGAGWTERSVITKTQSGDIFDTANGVDNSWMNAFIANGIPGVLHFFFLLVLSYRVVIDRRWDKVPNVAVYRWICMFLFLNFALMSAGATRYAKIDQMSMYIIYFAILAGLQAAHMAYGNAVFAEIPEEPRRPKGKKAKKVQVGPRAQEPA